MQNRRAYARQRSDNALHKLRRQVDFRHQKQGLPSGGDHACCGREIDFGFAAAGDALHERRCEFERLRQYCTDGGTLLRIQRMLGQACRHRDGYDGCAPRDDERRQRLREA